MRFHGHDLRKGRVSIPGHAYLLTAVTHGRAPLFSDWTSACLLAREIHALESSNFLHSLAWVIMPDHLHWLIQLRSGTLSAIMQRLKSRSAIAINSATGDAQKIWQKGFHDRAIRQEEDLLQAARYIVANPLRCGICKKLGDYPFWNAAWLEAPSPL